MNRIGAFVLETITSIATLRGLLAFLVFGSAIVAARPLAGQQSPRQPLFSPAPNVGWISYGPEFIPAPSGPQPVTFDPAHPFINNAIEYNVARPGTKDESQQPTFPVADLTNPILQPWVREELRKLNERVLAGRPLYSRESSCLPMGVPGFLLYVVNPVFFFETPKEVVMIATDDIQVRHVYLNVPHSRNPKPTWYGESVGHYEDDTLVVDTIGLSTKAFIDNYRTPHTEKLHVIERFQIIEGGKTLEVKVHIEDPGAFTTPWDVSQRYARSDLRPIQERTCTENNANYFNLEIDPTPKAEKPDF